MPENSQAAPAIRLAGAGDADAVVSLMRAFRDWWRRDVPAEENLGASVRRLIGEEGTDFLLAEGPGGPAGVCQLRYRHSLWTGSDDCFVEDLFVLEEARRGGVGRRLVEAAIERARARGCARIELDVNEANPAAVALYESLGFSAWADPPGGRGLAMRRAL